MHLEIKLIALNTIATLGLTTIMYFMIPGNVWSTFILASIIIFLINTVIVLDVKEKQWEAETNAP